LIFILGRFLEKRYCRLFKNGIKVTRAKREIDNVVNCGNDLDDIVHMLPDSFDLFIFYGCGLL